MPTLWVRLDRSRSYPIVIAPGALDDLGRLARPRLPGRTLCLVTHPRILRLYGRRAQRSLAVAGFRVHTLCLPEGEPAKSLAHAERICGAMLRWRLGRDAAVVALGGGVIGDLAGFAAAVYLRGVPFIQVPTTLLAQVDSSVGGKVAVNHALGKNTIGAFHQPRLVVSDPGVLATLSERQFRSGLAEVIKAGIIADARFFAALERRLPALAARSLPDLAWAIARACALKARVVEQDETEQGRRAILNYGHTLGHALEAYHGYRKYLHGEAVALGMAAAARLAGSLGVCTPRSAERQVRLLERAGLPVRGQGETVSRLMALMKTDKKARVGQVNFVLTPTIGNAKLYFKLTPFSVRRAVRQVVVGA
jgi:3-dehydroquinate synthase